MSSNVKSTVMQKRSDDSQLQAIVLTDCYNNAFCPLSLERPRCLLKIANIPLIEYTLQFLALTGVKDVILFLGTHSDQVKSYIESSQWSNDQTSPFKIRMIVSQEELHVGDAMRVLDERSLITSDFLLISGDVVGSIDMADILKQHEKRRETDKNAIMTMVLRETGPIHRTRAKNDMAVFAIHPQTGQCLHYEPIIGSPRKKHITMDLEVFERVSKVEIRNDLTDCQIDICSPEVPPLFTENFDYQDIRRDFVHGVLTSDLMGKTIYCHIVQSQYAARVRDLATFDALSEDIICRWTFPIVPDTNLLEGQTYKYQPGHIYKESNVILARSCVIKEHTVIGAGTHIGESTIVHRATIGRNCTIGQGCLIEGAYIWDNVTIGDHCTISKSLIADGVVIGQKSIVESGALISFNVQVDEGCIIPGNTRLTRIPGGDANTDILGTNGLGVVYNDPNWDDVEFSRFVLDNCDMSDTSLSSTSSIEPQEKSRRMSMAASDTSLGTTEDGNYLREAISTWERAFENHHKVDDTAVELSSLRMSCNAGENEVRRAAVMALVRRAAQISNNGLTRSSSIVASLIEEWSPVLLRLGTNSLDEAALIEILRQVCSLKEYSSLYQHFLSSFYNEDIISSAGLVKACELIMISSNKPKYLDLVQTTKVCRDSVLKMEQESSQDSQDD